MPDIAKRPGLAKRLYVLRDHVAAVRRRLDVAAAS
jgi:hypothetical protein